MAINLIMRRRVGCHDISLRYIVIAIITGLFISGCNTKDKETLSPLDEYFSYNEWIKPEDGLERLTEKNMTYAEVVETHGAPVYEFEDTVINGMNIKTSVYDFDLYPITMERDTVYVHRYWWFLSYKKNLYLYLVYESGDESSLPIYGYMH